MTPAKPRAIVIGASAGALEALSSLLPVLPFGYAIPIMIVVHVPPDKKSALAGLFHAKCAIEVREAEDKEPIEPGVAYFAPPNYHLLVEPDETLSLSVDPPVLYSRPAIDVLFESASDVYGHGLIGIILSGANSDGAKGLASISAAGGAALVQDPASAHSAAMPEAAISACTEAKVLSLNGIAAYLREAGGQ
jgi:two-component system, chemotaxis family, protein-glutamate methylesterase/glutaminase